MHRAAESTRGRCRAAAVLGARHWLSAVGCRREPRAAAERKSWGDSKSDCPVGGDIPRADCVVVIVRAWPADANELGQRGLDVARFVDRATHDARRLAVPLPHVLEANMRF